MNNPFCLSQHETENERYTRIQKTGHYYKCVKCNGTGLDNYIIRKDLTLWDGMSNCKVCNGLGIFDWVENLTCNIETELVEKEHG